MAKIVEDVVVIRFSKIVKDSETNESTIIAEDTKQTLEQVAQELVGDSIIVEVVSQ